MGGLLVDWVRQLVFLILFASVIEMVLPEGELRRYVKMVLGLVVILAVLEPLMYFMTGSAWSDSIPGVFSRETLAVAEAIEAGNDLFTRANARAQSAVLVEMETQLAGLEGVRTVDLDWDGPRPRLRVEVDAAADVSAMTGAITQVVQSYLGWDASMVQLEKVVGGRR